MKASVETISVGAFIALPFPGRSPDACHIVLMSSDRATHETLSGDLSDDYIVVEQRDDGSVVVKPDTSMAAIHRRNRLTPATLEEFEAEYGPVQPWRAIRRDPAAHSSGAA